MDSWIEITKWVGVAIGAVVVIGGLIVAALSWLLTHPRD